MGWVVPPTLGVLVHGCQGLLLTKLYCLKTMSLDRVLSVLQMVSSKTLHKYCYCKGLTSFTYFECGQRKSNFIVQLPEKQT